MLIEVPASMQEREGSCICVLMVSILSLSTILIFDYDRIILLRGQIGLNNSLNRHAYSSARTKAGKRGVMYLCVNGD